ncbi:MAG: SRPBCC domain-containing protein [Pedobacter sp.]|nr:MAG: SRPBCC domain-containing protein [Pedobacter sp.]
MKSNLLPEFSVNKENNSIHLAREFNASLELVWKAWTTSELLDKWWGPKPYHVETKTLDFTEGGHWLYAMVSPQGEKHWSLDTYKTIEPLKRIVNISSFSDEEGNPNDVIPQMHWDKGFTGAGDTTTVNIQLVFKEAEGLETLLKMGFKEGFTMGMENLDEVLSGQEI